MEDIDKLTYKEAMTRLDKIMTKLRSEAVDVDTLGEMTKDAVALLKHCRERLTTTEESLKATLEQLQPKQ